MQKNGTVQMHANALTKPKNGKPILPARVYHWISSLVANMLFGLGGLLSVGDLLISYTPTYVSCCTISLLFVAAPHKVSGTFGVGCCILSTHLLSLRYIRGGYFIDIYTEFVTFGVRSCILSTYWFSLGEPICFMLIYKQISRISIIV